MDGTTTLSLAPKKSTSFLLGQKSVVAVYGSRSLERMKLLSFITFSVTICTGSRCLGYIQEYGQRDKRVSLYKQIYCNFLLF